ncbi:MULTISPECIES: LLM class flavin-dependent oxidoreductase [Streptomyces]|uniref:Luciferase-like domain-containing protein n=1 Tax=Streptomyces canarius TaxID=285453 RepID=A0ABQ3CHX4_9ACTN|nr:hypothetical protein GCM10010345_19000 [Streptomyces canarius]
MGLLVTCNHVRPPAVLGEIATTVDVIVGENPAVAEYAAYGLSLVPPAEGIARLKEAITILRGIWTRDVFGFHGRYYTLTGNHNEPEPVQRPGPAPADRRLRKRDAPPGRRAGRHPEHPRTAAQHAGLHHRAQCRSGRPPRGHRP